MDRILLIATEYAPGMIPYASSIINALSESSDFEIYAVVVNSEACSYCNNLGELQNIEYIEYPHSKFFKLIYKIYPARVIRKIKKIAKARNIDAIHLLTGDFSLFFYVLFQLKKKKFYYTVHDLQIHESDTMTFPGRLLHKYVIWCTRTYLKIIPNLTTSSQHQYETLKKSYPNKHVVFNHFPSLVTQAIKNGRSQIEELKNTSDYILFFGTVDHYKGVDLLIEAYDQKVFHDRHKLVIAGKGRHYVTDNKNIIRLNRFIKDAEVRDLFTKAAIVVYPYRSATMSGVLSLAFYFRKKVVMSDVPFFKEYANRDSLFFKAGNVEDLADKLQQALDSGSASTNANLYPEFYSENILEQDYIHLYSSPANKQM